jgi:methylmalonyl-CoA mutase cobalamin-binding subunit
MTAKKCDEHIARTIDMAKEMITLAQMGYDDHEDPGCGVLYGILLDSGYRILDLALKEKQAHIDKGWWFDTVKKDDEQP